MRRETREQWGARPPKNRRYDVGLHGVAIHYPGADASFRSMPHSSHQQFMRDWQAQHMARGSNDLEYGSVICPCGVWMEARTEFDRPTVRVGSNGNSDANYRYTSLQIMLGTRDTITDAEVGWLGEAVAWLRSNGWGGEVVGHRDLTQTACPGDSVYAALPRIRAAADRHGNGELEPEPDDDEEDSMLVVRGPSGAAFLIVGATRKHGIHSNADLQALRASGVPYASVEQRTFDAILKDRG